MPISSASFVRYTALLFALVAAALIAIVGTTLYLVERTQSDFDNVIAARQVRSAAADLLSMVQDAETGQRGYLLTGEAAFLEPYTTSVARFDAGIARFRERLAAVAEPPATAESVARTLADKRTEMQRSIDLMAAGRADDALVQVRNETGKRLMDELRTQIGAVLERAETRLQSAVDRQRQSANALRIVSAGGALVILASIIGAGWMVVVYTRDLTAARRAMEEINATLEARVLERTEDLQRANEEVQRFAYIVTHDLRAPLVNIMGFTSELDAALKSLLPYVEREPGTIDQQTAAEARQAAREDLPEAIGFIRSSTKKMDGLINAILKISREGRRPLKPERIDLKEMLAATAASVTHQVEETGGGIAIDVAVGPVMTDRMSLDQIIGNLLDNAVKYRLRDRPLRIGITARRVSGNRVSIAVSDNGRGIAASDHARVFDLFRRSGAQDQAGEGIGLTYVRTLVRNLGGDVTLQSEIGQGTTFTVLVPADLTSVIRSEQS